MSKQKVYVVAPGRIASHPNGTDYHEGEEIDLSHRSAEEIQNLIAIGLVVEKGMDKPTPAKHSSEEVTND